MNLNDRTSGILLHLSSLPGPHCCGDMGKVARRFADFLARAGQKWWQMLPINPIDSYFSPYSSVSAFAGDPIYIDLEDLLAEGLLQPGDLDSGPTGPKHHTGYRVARDYRSPRWKKAFARFRSQKNGTKYAVASERFLEECPWVHPYALFCALAGRFGTEDWSAWPDEDIRMARPEALRAAAAELDEHVAFHAFLQLVFYVQWGELRTYCNERGIGLIGDVPIYVSKNSVDTWSNTRLFQIDARGRLERVAGVPGDAFNPEGQRWNAPLYRWDVHHDDGYSWWISRLRNTLNHFDAVRLDHFIGFYNYYSMPPEEPDPELLHGEALPPEAAAELLGKWNVVPQDALFEKIKTEIPHAQFIAEDLGVMKQGVRELRDRFGFPGINVFQFCFDFCRGDDPTTSWRSNSVVCTGTHDTPPLSGWLDAVWQENEAVQSGVPLESRQWNWPAIESLLKSFIGGTEEWKGRFGHVPLPDGRSRDWPAETPPIDRKTLIRAMVEATMHSPGNTAIFPMQDVIGAESDSRMNFPGHAENNWCWRLDEDDLSDELADRFAFLTWQYRRK